MSMNQKLAYAVRFYFDSDQTFDTQTTFIESERINFFWDVVSSTGGGLTCSRPEKLLLSLLCVVLLTCVSI